MKTEPDRAFDLAKLALKRNDEAIRFSDTKATIMLSLASIAFTLLLNGSGNMKQLLDVSYTLPHILAKISLILIIGGLLTVIGSTIYVIIPRMTSSKKPGALFFGDYLNRSEKESEDLISNLTAEESISQIISEIHITSEIASQKFRGNQIATYGLISVMVGLFLIFLTFLIF